MFVCTECGDEFKIDSDLGIHLTHEEGFGEEIDNNRCKCTLCNAEFNHWDDLDMHLMYGHQKCKITGTDLAEHEEVLNNPEFTELLAEIKRLGMK